MPQLTPRSFRKTSQQLEEQSRILREGEKNLQQSNEVLKADRTLQSAPSAPSRNGTHPKEHLTALPLLCPKKKTNNPNAFTSDSSNQSIHRQNPGVHPLCSSSWQAYAADPAHQATKTVSAYSSPIFL
jgi:hypothetical protein